jgi:outer membrane immunogenic protein
MTKRLGIHSLAQVVTVLALLGGATANAQNASPFQKHSSLEVTYDYVHSNGPPSGCGCFSLNGGGAALVVPVARSPFSVVGSIAATHGGGIGPQGYSLTLFTYTIGTRYTPRVTSRMFEPYGELQIGAVRATGSLANTQSAAGSSINSAFAGTLGGGVNLMTHGRIGFKLVDAEYLLTTYANGTNNVQNNLRISAGLTISLGSKAR